MESRLGFKLFRRLLLILPPAFRFEYEAEMLATLAERHRAARPTGRASMAFWLREYTALIRTARRMRTPRKRVQNHKPLRRGHNMSLLLQDIRIALRSLRRTPTFTLVSITTLALGIGATTAIFSVVHGVLLTPLSFEAPEQLITVWGEDQNFGQIPISVGDYRDIRDQSKTTSAFTARWSNTTSLTGGDGDPEEVTVAWVTPNHFEVLGIHPSMGRSFTSEEDDAVVLSHGLWRGRYGADPDLIGKRIQLSGDPFTVVGVLPENANPNLPKLRGARETNDVWRVMPAQWLNDSDRINGWLRIVGRLRPDATVAQARAEMDRIAEHIKTVAPDHAHVAFRLNVASVLDDLVQSSRPLLIILMGSVTFVLLIACFNVANLLLVRAQARAQEMAVRSALGGGRSKLVRQLFIESLVLALVGGGAGMALAALGIDWLLALQPANLPRLDTIGLDGTVLGFALVGSASSAVLFGLLPAFRATRTDLMTFLVSRGASRDRTHQRISRLLIVAEVALSLVLLVGTGLLLRSFAELRQIRPGFDTDHILTVSVTSSGREDGPKEATAFFKNLDEVLTALPGVEAVGSSNRLPLAGGVYGGPWANEEIKNRGDTEPEGSFRFVDPDYFTAMGTRLLAGRFFEPHEDWEVAIIDERMAERAWPGEDPIGKRIWSGTLGRNGDWSTVIGVVEHQRHTSVSEDYNETLFFPVMELFPGAQRYVVLRTSVDAAAVASAVRAALKDLDPQATLARVRTMRELVGNALAPYRFALILIALFAAVAVVLATVGLYGVISYSVSQRTREIGIRIAFGAARPTIMRLVLRQGLVLTGVGILLGVVGAVGLTRVIASLLVGVAPTDPLTFGAVAATLLAVGVAGSYMPARRALRVDPTVALRSE